jgi:hypothetical protein
MLGEYGKKDSTSSFCLFLEVFSFDSVVISSPVLTLLDFRPINDGVSDEYQRIDNDSRQNVREDLF